MAGKNPHDLIQGWAANLLLALDALDPGLLGTVMRAGSARRSVIACVLAHVGGDAVASLGADGTTPATTDEVIALAPITTDLRWMGGADLLSTSLGPSEPGLLGALAKTQVIEEPGYYRDLVAVFRDPSQRAVAGLVRQLDRLDADRLSVVRTLADEPALLTRHWVEMLDPQDAEDAVAAVRLLREQVFDRFDEQAFQQSAGGTKGSVPEFFLRWLERGDRSVPPPIDLGPECKPLGTPARLRQVGSTLKVCLGNLDTVTDLLSGHRYYWYNAGHGVVVEAEMLVGPPGHPPVPYLKGLHREGNRPLPLRTRQPVEAALAKAGLHALRSGAPASEWDVFRRLAVAGPFFFDAAPEEDAGATAEGCVLTAPAIEPAV